MNNNQPQKSGIGKLYDQSGKEASTYAYTIGKNTLQKKMLK